MPKRRSYASVLSYFAMIFIAASSPFAMAFDNDRSISAPNFRLETFLDIKSYEIEKTLNWQWQQSLNGWRVASGSLDFDRLFLDTELKLYRPLSSVFGVYVRHNEATFYDIKPAQRSNIELALTPFSIPISFSFISTPTYDKRQSDLGGAIAYGQQPLQYIKISHMQQDLYFNEKNVYDEDEYRRIPEVTYLEGAWIKHPYYLTFEISRDQPTWFQSSSDGTQIRDENFRSHGHRYEVESHYALREHDQTDYFGIDFKGFWQKKSLTNSSTQQRQTLYQRSYEVYWLRKWVNKRELSFGVQFDEFVNVNRNHQLGAMNVPGSGAEMPTSTHSSYNTLQTYGISKSPINAEQAWSYGIFIGNANQDRQHNTEAKLRFTWYYFSITETDHFIAHVNFNMDEWDQWQDANDTWDGGGISYQIIF